MKRMAGSIKRALGAAASWTPDALLVGGACAVAYGVREIYAPAGWIVLGAFCLAAGRLLAKGGK